MHIYICTLTVYHCFIIIMVIKLCVYCYLYIMGKSDVSSGGEGSDSWKCADVIYVLSLRDLSSMIRVARINKLTRIWHFKTVDHALFSSAVLIMDTTELKHFLISNQMKTWCSIPLKQSYNFHFFLHHNKLIFKKLIFGLIWLFLFFR